MKKIRKTKIIATIGPATSSYSSICKLIKSGVNIFRLNFSHGDYNFFNDVIRNIKNARNNLNRPVAIMQDLQGPKIRIGKLTSEISVKRGDQIIIRNKRENLNQNDIYIDFSDLYKYINKGQKILINDGTVELKVKEIKNKDIICNVVAGGKIQSRKGVNLPNVRLPIPSLTKKDITDLKFGLKNGIDAVCLSFVRDASDLLELKKYIKSKNILIIAKIEKPEALKHIDEILDLCDGIMVARGDLAVEAGYSVIPVAQKEMILKANKKGKIVIVATQMLESMVNSSFPQRAEITDIYNAVIDGADILMLSAETSIGKYPYKTVYVMNKIILQAEKEKKYKYESLDMINTDNIRKNIISYCAVLGSYKLKNSIIAVRCKSINDVSFVSDYRPEKSVVAFTDNRDLYNKLSFINSVYPLLCDEKNFLYIIKRKNLDIKTVIYLDFHTKYFKLIFYDIK